MAPPVISSVVFFAVFILHLFDGVLSCSDICRDARDVGGADVGYQLSLNCDIPDVGVEFISNHNNHLLFIREMHLECKASDYQHCIPIFQRHGEWNYKWRENMYETHAVNTSLIQECKPVGCYAFNLNGAKYKFESSRSCKVTGVTAEFEETRVTVVEGQNTSVCVGLQGQVQIPSNVSIEVINSSTSSSNFQVSEYRVDSLSENYERRCIDIAVVDDYTVMKQELELDLSVLSKETVRLGNNRRAIITVVENDGYIAFENNASVVEGQNVTACVKVSGLYNTNFSIVLNSTDGVDYLVGKKQIIRSSEELEYHCVEIQTFDNEVLEESKELTCSIEFNRDIAVSTNSMTITVLDNDSEVMLEKSNYLVKEEQGSFNVCIIASSLHSFEINITIFGLDSYSSSDIVQVDNNRTCTVIPIIDDEIHEATEQREIIISSLDNLVTVKQDRATIRILDNDELALSIEEFSDIIKEGDNIRMCMHLSTQAAAEISYNLIVKSVLNFSPDDNSLLEINSTFPSNSRKCHNLNITENDSIVEVDEEFNITVKIESTNITQSIVLSVIDDDKVIVGFAEKDLFEGHSIEEYCIEREGDIERPIVIEVTEDDTMSDQVIFTSNNSQVQCFNKTLAMRTIRLSSNDSAVIFSRSILYINTKDYQELLLNKQNLLLASILSGLCVTTAVIAISLFLRLYLKQWNNTSHKHYNIELHQSTDLNENDDKILFRIPPSHELPKSQSCVTTLDELGRDCYSIDMATVKHAEIMNSEDIQTSSSLRSEYYSAVSESQSSNTDYNKEDDSVHSSDKDKPLLHEDKLESGTKVGFADEDETNYIPVPKQDTISAIDLDAQLSLELYESESLSSVDDKDSSTSLFLGTLRPNKRNDFSLTLSKSFEDRSQLKTYPNEAYNRPCASHQNISELSSVPYSEICKEKSPLENPNLRAEVCDDSVATSLDFDLDLPRNSSNPIQLNASNDGYVDCSNQTLGHTKFVTVCNDFHLDKEDTVLPALEYESGTELNFSASYDYV